MGGTQSWLNCDGNYRSAGGVPATGEQSDTGGGDPIIAVMMFLGTLFGLLFLTALVHCAFIAWRGCRSRHSRRHQQRRVQAPQQDVSNPLATTSSVGGSVEPMYSSNKMAVDGGTGEADADGETSSCSSSSSSLTSSDTSLDSTTARIAAQVASRRRSRFLDLAGARLNPAAPGASSPTPSWRPPDDGNGGGGGGGGFLRPPPQRGAFENPAYDHHYDP